MTFNLESLVLSVSRLISLIPSSPGLSSTLSCFEINGVSSLGEGKGVEYNGLIGDKGAKGNLVLANNEQGRASF